MSLSTEEIKLIIERFKTYPPNNGYSWAANSYDYGDIVVRLFYDNKIPQSDLCPAALLASVRAIDCPDSSLIDICEFLNMKVNEYLEVLDKSPWSLVGRIPKMK